MRPALAGCDAMSKTKLLTQHYSATYEDQDIGTAEIRDIHLARGFSDTGYHWIIRLGGQVETGRTPETRAGAHVGGHNGGNIGICVIGGLRRATGGNVGHDTRTREQIAAQIQLNKDLLARHPNAKLTGHKDLKATQCPGYDVAAWWASVNGTPTAQPAPDLALPAVSYPLIKLKSRGEPVKVLQRALALLGYRVGGADGKFGPMTQAAVRAFQRASGVPDDGAVGPVTWAQIFKAK
jgi:N-acetylmuramoyl-L-alanine amidase